MAYPVAPWYLQGRALLTLHWIDTDRARPWVPAALEIQSILPGKTLGGVLLASYGAGSVLEYNELIVTPALVNHEGNIGTWISHIYVDDVDSVAGGREIWGLPKQLADFHWGAKAIEVAQPEVSLCRAEPKSRWLSLPDFWQPSLTGHTFCQRGAELAQFKSHLQGQLHVANTHLSLPANSPFADLCLGQPWLAIEISDLKLTVEAPQRLRLISEAGVRG